MEDEYSGSEGSCASENADTGELDAIFYQCDEENKGLVPVSTLVAYLKENASNGSTEECQSGEIESLRNLLDPENEDILIDKDTFGNAVLHWMESVYNNNNESFKMSPGFQEEGCQTPLNCLKSRLGSLVGLTPNNSPRISLFNTSVNNFVVRDSMLNHSIETTGLASGEKQHLVLQDLDVGELLSQVETLQFHNKRLIDENAGLKEQLISAEDATSQLSQRIDHLNKDVKNHQATVEKLQELRLEHEDLKLSIATVTEQRKELKQKIRQLEKDNSLLENSRLLLEGQVNTLAVELEATQKTKKELQTSLTGQKKMLSEAESIAAAQESQLIEETAKVEELEKAVKDFNKVNETLRQEKTDLEMQLNHTQHELTSLRLKSERINLNGSDDLDDVSSLNEEEFMPVMSLAPTAASTPFSCTKAFSLCYEIQDRIQEEPRLPTPLCEKELEDVVESNLSGELDDEVIKSTFNLDKMANEFKKNKVLQRLKGYDEGNPDSPVRPPEIRGSFTFSPKPEVVCSILQKELGEYSEKIAYLASLKQIADKRNIVLKEKLRRVKEKNVKIQEQLESAVNKLDIEIQMKHEMEQKVTLLQEEILEEKKEKEEILQQLKDWKDVVGKLEKDLHESENHLADLQIQNTELEKNVENLKSANAELTDLYQRSEADISKLEVTFKEVSHKHGEELGRIHSLEDHVRKLHLERQMDMKELWKIAHNDNNSSNEDLDLNTSVAKEMREKVSQEIENLRTQLVKSQAALETLQTKALPQLTLHLSQSGRFNSSNCDDVNGNQKVESPLVEALTLDSYNKRLDSRQLSHLYSDEKYSKNSAWGSHNNLRRSDSSSCPDFEEIYHNPKKLSTNSPSYKKGGFLKRKTPFVGNVRYAAANVSTGSSTSGVEISSTSPRSERLLNNKKNVLFINSFNSPDNLSSSAEDLHGDGFHLKNRSSGYQNGGNGNGMSYEGVNQLSPMSRMRTPSFKHAIERGPSGDSGISNPSQDHNSNASLDNLLSPRQEDLLPHESDLIKVGFFTEKSRANLLLGPSNYRAGYYDRKCVHVPGKDEWNTDDYIEDSDHLYNLEAFNNIGGYNYPNQRPRKHKSNFDNFTSMDNEFIDYNKEQADVFGNTYQHNGIEHSFSNYNNMLSTNDPINQYQPDRSLSPAALRRLSALPEKEESAEDMNNQSEVPVPPPRKSKCKSPTAPARTRKKSDVKTDTNVNVLAHFQPHLSDERPEHQQTVLKESINANVNTGHCDSKTAENKSVNVNRDHSTRENPPYRPPSDTVQAYQAVRAAPFSRPPPPYRKPFTNEISARNISHENNYVDEIHHIKQSSISDNSNVTKSQCDAIEVNVIKNKCDETFSRGSDDHSGQFESIANTTYTQFSNSDDKEVGESVDFPLPKPDLQQRRQSLEMIHRQGHLDCTEEVHGTDQTKEQNNSNKINMLERKEGFIMTDKMEEKCVSGIENQKRKSISEISRTKTFDESTSENVVPKVKEKDNCEENTQESAIPQSNDEHLKEEPDIKEEILNGLEKKVIQPLADSPKSQKASELAKVREENLAKKRLLDECSKMPELTESQEDAQENGSITHSADGESATQSVSPDSNTSSQGKVFPSLTDKVLAKWGLKRGPKDPLECAERLTEKEIEDHYCSVVLAFKSDKETLDQRVDLQLRARDTTEENIHDEMQGLNEAMTALEPFCNDLTSREIYAKIQKHIEVLNVSQNRLTSRCEMLGASKQEFRLSRAVDVLVKHVENLKRMYEKEHQELEQTRKLLEENKLLGPGLNEKFRVSSSLSNSMGAKVGRRRASVAVLRTSPMMGTLPGMGMNPNLYQVNVKQLDAQSFFNRESPRTDSTHRSSLYSPANNSFNRRRASVAITPTSFDKTSSLMSPSFLNYRNNRVNSISSTSSEESYTSKSPRSSLIGDSIAETEQLDDLHEETNKSPDKLLASPNLALRQIKRSNSFDLIENKTNTQNIEAVSDLLKFGDSNNNNNSDNSNTNNNNNSPKIHVETTEEPSASCTENGIAEEEDLQTGLTDDRKLSMTHSINKNAEFSKPDNLEEKIKSLVERQDTIEGDMFEEEDNFIEKLWQNMPEWKDLKLRVRYIVAGMVFFMGIFSLMMVIVPQSEAVERKPFQGRLWTTVGEILWPYITLHRNSPPPY